MFIGIYTKNISSSLPYTYDQSNNGSICNNMAVVVKVAESFEPYIYAESGVMMMMMMIVMMMIMIVMMRW
jgi:hypothetical protein